MKKKEHLGFKAAFEAALKEKLKDMPQMIIASDLMDEMKDRRCMLKPSFYGVEDEIARNGFNIGVDAVYQLLFLLLEVPPAEWDTVSTSESDSIPF